MSLIRKWLLATAVLMALGFAWVGGGWACVAFVSGVSFMDPVVPMLVRRSRLKSTSVDSEE